VTLIFSRRLIDERGSSLLVIPPLLGAIGRTKGGRNTKVHAISDEQCRPLVFYLTPGQTIDIKGAVMLGASFRLFQTSPTERNFIPLTKPDTKGATSSSACLGGSRISGVLQLDTIRMQTTSSRHYVWPSSYATGFE